MRKKLLSILLMSCMVLTMLPNTVLADVGIQIGRKTRAVTSVEINEKNFPDKNFREFVRQYDLNDDNSLSAEEISDVKEIYVYNRHGEIENLTGIEYFTALETLNCSENNLTELDVSKNTALKELYCGRNNLTELDVSKNTALKELYCDGNNLTELGVSKNTALETFDCSSNNLTELDVSKNTALKELNCGGNNLTELDVSKNTALKELYCDGNNLTELGVSKNTELQYLWCSSNNLTELDVSKNTALETLNCSENNLTELDVSKNTALKELYCGGNNLTELGVSKNTALETLNCSQNNLTELDVSKNIALETLNCSENNLTELDVSKNIALDYLVCSSNNLKVLDVSKNTELSWLMCYVDNLTELDVSKNTALETLNCSQNNLTELDVSKNIALDDLCCHGNHLTELDVSKNTELQYLWCSYNNLTELDVSKNTALETLYCEDNTYRISIDKNRNFNLSKLPGGFDVKKASNWNGGVVNKNTLKVDSDKKKVTYNYDCGNGKSAQFALVVNENSTSKKGFCQNNKYVKQLDPENLLQNINIDGGKISSPQMKILGKTVSLLDMDSNVKFPLGDSVQAVYDPKENKVEVLIGFKEMSENAAISADGNTTAYWSESYKQVKNLYRKVKGNKVSTKRLWNDYSKLRGKLKKQNNASLGINVNASIAGYMEFSCGSGEVKFSEGGLVTELGTGADYNFHWAPPFSAVYTRVALGIDAKDKVTLKYTKGKKASLSGSVGIDGSLTGAIGVGTRKGGTYAEGAMTGTLKNTLKFPAQTLENSLSIVGNLKAKINVAVLNYDLTEDNLEHNFGDYQFYPRTSSSKSRVKNYNLDIKASDLKLVERTAGNNIATYSGNESFEKDNTFSNASPQLISLSDGKKLLIWNDDDPQKTNENNVAVFYSVYDGNKWSEEKILEDDGCLCSTVSCIENNGKVEILFSRSNEKIQEGSSLDDTLTKMDLYTTEFDGTEFTTPKKLSTEQNSLYEMMYGMGLDNGNVYYAWVENTENSYFLSEGTNNIYMMEGGEKTLVQETENIVSDVVTDPENKLIVWKEVSKDDDQTKIYKYDGETKEELPITENCSNLKIQDHQLFYMTESGIGYTDLETGNENETIPINLDDYEIKKSGEDYYIVYRQTTEDGGQSLWMIHGKDDEWSEPVQITNDKFYVKSMSININEEGSVVAARNLAEITKDGIQFDKGNLVVDTLDDYADLVCGNSLIYDENSIKPSEKMTFTYTVYNNSQRDINSYQVELKDGNGNTLLEDTIDHEIKAGEKKEEILEYTLPNELKKTDVALTIKAPYKEKNINNNSCSTTYGYADAEITDMESQNGKVRITFCNNGYEDIDDFKIRLYMDSKETEALCTYTGEKLKVGEAKTMECVIPKDKLTKSGGKGSLIAEISISNEEDIVENNTKYIDYFWEKEGVVKDNTEHQKDVEKDNTKYTEYFGEKKTLISKISITGISKNIARGKKILLKANIYPTEASNKNVTWKSSNRKFATVNKNGVVTIKKKAAGKTVTITAIANDGSGKTATYKIVAMKGIVKKITIPGKKSVKAGKTLKLKAKVKATKGANKKLIWKSGNTKYATVSKDGKVKTMKTGKGRKVKITAMATDGSGKKKTVTIKIK